MNTAFATVSTSLCGLRRSLVNMRRETQTVAHAVVEGATADLTGAAVRSTEQKRAAEANAAALRRANEALGSVVDILV